jgi:hypothetical protein
MKEFKTVEVTHVPFQSLPAHELPAETKPSYKKFSMNRAFINKTFRVTKSIQSPEWRIGGDPFLVT